MTPTPTDKPKQADKCDCERCKSVRHWEAQPTPKHQHRQPPLPEELQRVSDNKGTTYEYACLDCGERVVVEIPPLPTPKPAAQIIEAPNEPCRCVPKDHWCSPHDEYAKVHYSADHKPAEGELTHWKEDYDLTQAIASDLHDYGIDDEEVEDLAKYILTTFKLRLAAQAKPYDEKFEAALAEAQDKYGIEKQGMEAARKRWYGSKHE